MKELLQFLLGIALTIIGVIIFLQNVVVSSLHAIFPDGTRECRRYSDCAHRCGIYRIYCEAEHADRTFTDRIVHCVFVCLVISLNVSMRYMSGLELALILGTIGVGVGFIIKGLLGVNKADKEGKKQGK